jgi:predicted transport protein
MTLSSLAKKMHIRPNSTVTVLNAPAGMAEILAPVPAGASVTTSAQGKTDLVLLFVQDSAELATWVKQALDSLGSEASLWVAYPKQSSKIATDLNRDQGWTSITSQGFQPNASIAVDDTWSAVRFRPAVAQSEEDLVAGQYSGARAALRPLYEQLRTKAQSLGTDVGITTRQSYVAFTRGKQFALIKPSRDRLDLALKLPDAPPHPRLLTDAGTGSGSMTHRVVITSTADIDTDVTSWLELAYRSASK